MKLVVTILEETFDAALNAIRSLSAHHDMIELRAESLGAIDLPALRASTSKPIILTYRGSRGDSVRAIEAGIDFVDVEWREDLRLDVPPHRVVLSHHDFDAMPDVESILAKMKAFRCAHTKLAVTPSTLDENLRLLSVVSGVTVIGMGERGLYSRILAPFLGSELAFVAASKSAAPGQLSLERALAIYGREPQRAKHVFAIAGNPAGHSLSPTIHNPLFREKGVDAAYTIASFESFDEIARAFENGDIRGLSITAPFKELALEFAKSIGANIADNAREAGSINTLVRRRDGFLADNTDVDGFAAIIGRPKSVAIAGAGGTARAALVAARRANANVRVFNRSAREFPIAIEPLEKLRDFDGDLIINTTGAALELPAIRTIDASYANGSETGLALLHAQAIRQNAIFVEAIA